MDQNNGDYVYRGVTTGDIPRLTGLDWSSGTVDLEQLRLLEWNGEVVEFGQLYSHSIGFVHGMTSHEHFVRMVRHMMMELQARDITVVCVNSLITDVERWKSVGFQAMDEREYYVRGNPGYQMMQCHIRTPLRVPERLTLPCTVRVEVYTREQMGNVIPLRMDVLPVPPLKTIVVGAGRTDRCVFLHERVVIGTHVVSKPMIVRVFLDQELIFLNEPGFSLGSWDFRQVESWLWYFERVRLPLSDENAGDRFYVPVLQRTFTVNNSPPELIVRSRDVSNHIRNILNGTPVIWKTRFKAVIETLNRHIRQCAEHPDPDCDECRDRYDGSICMGTCLYDFRHEILDTTDFSILNRDGVRRNPRVYRANFRKVMSEIRSMHHSVDHPTCFHLTVQDLIQWLESLGLWTVLRPSLQNYIYVFRSPQSLDPEVVGWNLERVGVTKIWKGQGRFFRCS
jgi:hypothetical protein